MGASKVGAFAFAVVVALALNATDVAAEPRVRCDITSAGGIWTATMYIENPTATAESYEITVVLSSDGEEWRSLPIVATLAPGAQAGRAFRPFAKDRTIDRCWGESGGRPVAEPPPLPAADMHVYFETSHRFGRWFGIQNDFVADGVLVGIGAELGVTSDFGSSKRVRAGGGVSVAAFGIDISENDVLFVRLQPRVRYTASDAKWHLTLQPGVGLADHGAKVVSMSAGFGPKWYRADAEVMGIIGDGSELGENAWAATVGFSLSGRRALVPPAIEAVGLVLLVLTIGMGSTH